MVASNSSWTLGLILNLTGSILINGGTNLIKLAHNYHRSYNRNKNTDMDTMDTMDIDTTPALQDDDSNNLDIRTDSHYPNNSNENDSMEDHHHHHNRSKSGKWCYVAGIVTFSIGSFVNFMSFGFAPQSLLSALGSAQFVSNVAFGAFLLGERVTRRTLLATVTIVSGNMMIVLSFSGIITVNQIENEIDDTNIFGSSSSLESEDEEKIDADSIMKNFDLAFMLFTFMLFSCGCLIRRLYRRLHNRVIAGESVRMSGLIIPVSFAAYSAMFGAQSILLAKCLSMLIKARINGDTEEELGLIEHALFLLWCLPTAFWLSQLNRALAMFDGLIIIPLMQVCWMFFSILSGGVFFKEFHSFKWIEIQLFCFGILVVFYGVYLLFPAHVIKAGIMGSPLPFLRKRQSMLEMTDFSEQQNEEIKPCLMENEHSS